jgi:thiamine-monophosphate kinase
MTLSSLGEFALIGRLAGLLSDPPPEDVIVGIGDDAAVLRFGSEYLVATTDTMVDGVHFVSERVPWEDTGWKSLASNVSDIAAMGATPLFALVTLALPTDARVEDSEALYAGLRACAGAYSVAIVGGDIVRAPQVSVTVALLGRAEQRNGAPLLLRRDGARPGDVLAVTGTVGDSAAGLLRLRNGAPPGDPLVRAHVHPVPSVAVGVKAVAAGIRCAIDVSDGLLQDIGHICEMSGVGAIVRALDVPISDELRRAYPDDALRLACTGGEDYQLVLAGPRSLIEELSREVEERATIIGEVVESTDHHARLLDGDGNEVTFQQTGWDAFRS